MNAEERLTNSGVVLPTASPPSANYIRAKQSGNLIFLAGHGPISREDGSTPMGKVGRDLTSDEGYDVARLCGLNLLATLRAHLGSLDRVTEVIKVFGMVNGAPGFTDTSKVINGCSDLLVEIFGEVAGPHARSAVGVAELPKNYPVEIEMIVAVD